MNLLKYKLEKIIKKINILRIFLNCKKINYKNIEKNIKYKKNIFYKKTNIKKNNKIKLICNILKSTYNNLLYLSDLLKIAKEENDLLLFYDIKNEVIKIKKKIIDIELNSMFLDKNDYLNAFLDITAGSGGIDAQDWANMLLCMYMKWCEKHKFKTKLICLNYGDITGIKSVTINIKGKYAFGWLKNESGVHRLVRKSPFNFNKNRHTSFASVFLSPEINNDINIILKPSDLRIDTYKSSGPGGQHVNTTNSAVRITHIPSGIIASCQNDRSQHINREKAIKILKTKLYIKEMQLYKFKKQNIEKQKPDISWSRQIRSYILDDNRVKDLRTNIKMKNCEKVLNGNLDNFILANLRKNNNLLI